MNKILIASDHGGYNLKNVIKNYLMKNSYEIEDLGTNSIESCHYPFYAHALAQKVNENEAVRGILICTTGQGMAITANKYPNVRAAICWSKEIAALSRAHNNANILCIPGAFVLPGKALEITDAFFSEPFEGGRHETRVRMINQINNR